MYRFIVLAYTDHVSLQLMFRYPSSYHRFMRLARAYFLFYRLIYCQDRSSRHVRGAQSACNGETLNEMISFRIDETRYREKSVVAFC